MLIVRKNILKCIVEPKLEIYAKIISKTPIKIKIIVTVVKVLLNVNI